MRVFFASFLSAALCLTAACGPSAPGPGAPTAAAQPASTCDDLAAHRAEGRAEQWVAMSGPALSVTGDLILAPALAQFQHFRPAGLRYRGNHEVGPLASALLGGSCAAVFALVVDPAPQSGDRALCSGAEAGFLAVRTAEDGQRLNVTVFPAGADPAAAGEPCQAFDYLRLNLEGGASIVDGEEEPGAGP